MRLLDRYLLRELLLPLAYCLCGFVILWTAGDLFQQMGDMLQKKKLVAHEIIEYYLYSTPTELLLILPMALLLALLYALTNHARHNEITAIRAAGISLWRVCLPYLAVGFAASLFLLVLNEFWLPDSADVAEQVLKRHTRAPGAPGKNRVPHLTFENSRDRRLWEMELYNVDTGEMTKPLVTWIQADGSSRWLSANRALRVRGVWQFYDVVEHLDVSKTNSLLVPGLRTNLLAMPEFSETPEQIKSEIKLASSLNLSAIKRPDIPVKDIVNYLQLHTTMPPGAKPWLYTKLHGRLAAPFTCLVVVLIAIPFAAGSGRRNVFVGVAGSICICFLYFILQQFGLAFGASGHLPPWLAAWFPNITFGLTGLWLTSRVR